MRTVDGAPLPEAPSVTTYRVLRPQAHGRLDLTMLGARLFGVAVHFVWDRGSKTGRSHPCTMQEMGRCLYHSHKQEWNGYVACWWNDEDKPAVLRVAPKEAGTLLAVLGSEGTWAGIRCIISPRVGNEGKVIRVELPHVQPPPKRWIAHAIEPTICAIYGIDRVPAQIGDAADAAGPVEGIDEWIPLPPKGGAS